MNRYAYIDEDKAKKVSHLHTLDTRPLYGTTTIINEIYPPPLVWWGAGMALMKLGWLNPKKFSKAEVEKAAAEGLERMRTSLPTMDLAAYMKFLNECYTAHDKEKNAKGKTGRDRHALIEKYIKTQMGIWNFPEEDGYFDEIKSFVVWANANVDRFVWCEGNCYSEKLWVGGISDFGFIHKKGGLFVGDNKPNIYPKHFIQTAGYGIQIKENGVLSPAGNLVNQPVAKIDGYMIFDYNTGTQRYRTDVAVLESDFVHTVEMYKRKDIIGVPNL